MVPADDQQPPTPGLMTGPGPHGPHGSIWPTFDHLPFYAWVSNYKIYYV